MIALGRIVYKSRIFEIEEYKPKLYNKTFARMTGFNSVAVVAILNNSRVVIERQYRPAVEEYLYEIPAGLIEKGEKPISAAVRELEEETGYFAKSVKPLFAANVAVGVSTEKMYYYLATGLQKTETGLDDDETIDVELIPIQKVLRMIRENKIKDNKTVAGLLYYMTYIKKGAMRKKK